MSFWLVLVIFFAVMIVVGIASAIRTSNDLKEIGSAISNIPGFSASFQYPGVAGGDGIAIDEKRSKVCLFERKNGTLSRRVIDGRDILSCELFEDGQTVIKTSRSSQVARALVGGMLLGNVGAFVGGMSAKRVESGKVERIGIRLAINDSVDPIHEICFLSSGSKRNGVLHKAAFKQARQWQTRLDALMRRAGTASQCGVIQV